VTPRITVPAADLLAAYKAHGTYERAAAYLGMSTSHFGRMMLAAKAEERAAGRDPGQSPARRRRRAARVEQSRLTGRWRDAAECLDPDVDPERFFPHESTKHAEDIAEAKAVCAVCPVLDACRRDVLTSPYPPAYGVFAGMTRNERAKARKAAAQ
jgi:hypothetical protein